MSNKRILPKVERRGGMPLMEALSKRQSIREYDYSKEISEQILAELLWATCGENRADGKRTAGSTLNKQSVSVYAVLEKGIYLYIPEENALKLVLEGDYREKTGMQPFVKDAAVNIVFVGDEKKLGVSNPTDSMLMLGVDAGLMSQNLYLYCASKGLGTVVRGSIDREAFGKLISLESHEKVLLAQTVSWPKE
ncbi:MAG: SagB/ThcOx family dehydrogenase [Kiritimatiellae bacterium]|nr:SagB/ThcOx family dehydrogenase [Kiritimatiellia bacterium]